MSRKFNAPGGLYGHCEQEVQCARWPAWTCVSGKFDALLDRVGVCEQEVQCTSQQHPRRQRSEPEANSAEGRVSGPSYSHRMRYEEAIHPVHSMHPFEALAEPARRRIVDILASGEHTAGELAAVVGQEFRISRTAVSKHLRILRDAGFVEVRGDFQWRWYYLTSTGIDRLEGVIADIRRKWDSRIGWDAELGCEADPLANSAHPVRRKGPGREPRRGLRGHQSTPPTASEPDQGWMTSF